MNSVYKYGVWDSHRHRLFDHPTTLFSILLCCYTDLLSLRCISLVLAIMSNAMISTNSLNKDVTILFQQCLLQNDCFVLNSVLVRVLKFFLADEESSASFELCGSTLIGGLWYGSDIDLRFVGSDAQRFFHTVSHFLRAVGCEDDFYWTGNLLTINVLDVKVDIFIVNQFDDVQLPPIDSMDGVCFQLVNRFNFRRVPFEEQPFTYDPARTAAFQDLYTIVGNDLVWRSLFLLLKSIDTKLSTCTLVTMVALAAHAHFRLGSATDKWRFGLEIVNRFLRTFLHVEFSDAEMDAPGARESFMLGVWAPFCTEAFPEIAGDVCNNPLPALFTVSQNIKLHQSVLHWVVCIKCYPAKAFSTPVFGMPRPIPPFLVHHAADFIIATPRFSELDLRRSADVLTGIRALSAQFVYLWGDVEFAEWMLRDVDAEITPYAVDRLYAITNGA